MTHLKIEHSQGKYSLDLVEYKPIDEITKEDLLALVDIVLTNGFQMDNPDEHEIKNDAHKIIYTNIYLKLKKLIDDKKSFKDESEMKYKEAIDKYSIATV
ncbi:hypothetical protein [Vibrio algarum]|uniref:Uncharacterized protein n=1 Tax=Vibrio algarum TaxID=3020714 RepID=A0ABT4YL09_9VIBR|nr:hypothetical protein [Vibrio sp. KJ40-1]MDB1122232.1 hypothetical protein [Vibrio sp. KJ40-1]